MKKIDPDQTFTTTGLDLKSLCYAYVLLNQFMEDSEYNENLVKLAFLNIGAVLMEIEKLNSINIKIVMTEVIDEVSDTREVIRND